MTDVVFAYDGSSHCGWVARYAIRLARNGDGSLCIVHVRDGAIDDTALDDGIGHMREIAEAAGVTCTRASIELAPDGVAATISAFMRQRPESVLVLGLRAREDGRGLLKDTVSDALLASSHHDVLAIRVVSPGLMASARHILYALSQNPNSARRGRHFLELLGLQTTRLSLLTVVSPALGRLAHPTANDLRALSAVGSTFLGGVQAELRQTLPPATVIDPAVVVSGDWPAEITRHAGRIGAELILLGATERTLPRRMLFGNPLERVLHGASCDVGVFRLGTGPQR